MKYRIKQTSPFNYILTFMLTFFIGMFILLKLSNQEIIPKGQPLIFVLFFAPIIILAFYLPKFTSVALIEIIIDETGITKRWLKQFLLRKKRNEVVKWNEIQNYIFQPDRQFDKFKLNLKSGKKFVFYHNNDHDDKDDFRLFLTDFINKVENINTQENITVKDKIRIGKTIYETKGGLILAILSIIVLVGLPILFIFSPHKDAIKTSNIFMLASSYIGAIYYIIQVYIHRKKRKEYDKKFE